MENTPLLFAGFFNAVKKELGYAIGVEKYIAFVTAFAQGQVPVYDYECFSRFCRILFLQNERDRAKFQKLLDNLLKAELDAVLQQMESGTTKAPQTTPPSFQSGGTTSGMGANTGTGEREIRHEGNGGGAGSEGVTGKQTLTRWFDVNKITGFSEQPQANISREVVEKPPSAFKYVHTEEYLPITRRQMIKTWHFLRREEKRGFSRALDIPQTVARIAREGAFIDPVYQKAFSNREKTLVIFADVKGSMAPFSELTNRLIQTALKEGGLKDTEVYYFQNYPLKYVYQTPRLLRPVPLFSALNRANRNFTIALVISDAGAARGNYVPERVKTVVGKPFRSEEDAPGFLELLQQYFAHIVWLNPMPRHRWAGSSAEPVSLALGYRIYSIFEEENFDFQHIVRAVMGGIQT